MSKTYDKYMEAEYFKDECACCECGYYRNAAHHPGIRCPKTGRCGECGNDWPCEDHIYMVRDDLKNKVHRQSYLKGE